MVKMKALLRVPIGVSLICIIASSCNGNLRMEDEASTARQTDQMTGLVETAVYEREVFENEVAVQLTERAPTVTNTPPPSLTPTETLTPTVTETVFRDPWVLQDICLKEPGRCVPYTFNNAKYTAWITIKLTHLESGISGEFSVQPMTIATITLIPGEYEGIYDGWCAGYIMRLTRVAELGAETGRLRCWGLDHGFVYYEY